MAYTGGASNNSIRDLYVDGVFVFQDTGGITQALTATLAIGYDSRYTTETNAMKGYIDDVRLYRYLFGRHEVEMLYQATRHLYGR